MKKLFLPIMMLLSLFIFASCTNNVVTSSKEFESVATSEIEPTNTSEIVEPSAIPSSEVESSTTKEIEPSNYYEYNGKLHVDGIYLKNEKDEIIQLNGVVTPMSSLESRDQWKEYDRINQLKEWGFNHIRIGYSVARPITDEMYKDLCDIIDLLTSLGFYMELIAYNDDTQMSNTTNYNIVKTYLTYFAEKYKDQDNIIYCVGNEPSTGITMEMIDEYASNLITEITKYKKDAVIAVPTPYACSEVDDCVYSTIDYENVIYVNHCYQSMTKKCYDVYRRINAAIANNKCVYISEWCAATPSSSEDYISPDEASNTAYIINKYHLPNCYYNYYPGCDEPGVEGPSLNHLGMVKQVYWRNNYTDPDALTISGKFAVGNVKNPITNMYGVSDEDNYTIINYGVNSMFSLWDEAIRIKIENIEFGKMEDKPQVFKEAFNLSKTGLGNVVGYIIINSNNLYDLKILSDKTIILPENSGYMFRNFTELKTISFKNVDSSKVTNIQFMFSNDTNLKSIDFTGFDASNITTMYATFVNTTSLEELDLSMFDTKSLTNITGLFQNSGIKKLNIKNFNFDKVTEKGYPFASSNPEIIVGTEAAKEFLLSLKSSLKITVEN